MQQKKSNERNHKGKKHNSHAQDKIHVGNEKRENPITFLGNQ